mgnify:CR=1 FL=1
MNKQNFDLTFLGKFILKMFKTLELPGGFAPLAPLLGLCPGPTGGLKRKTPRPIILHPPFLIPGYGPGIFKKAISKSLYRIVQSVLTD